MTMHPYIGRENIRERQREMIARADRRRLEPPERNRTGTPFEQAFPCHR